jgi:hypothetical protein
VRGAGAGEAGADDVERVADVGSGSTDPSAAAASAPCDTPAETKPLNAVALAKEVVLDRLQGMLEWLLRRLKRYRAGRGEWWEK